MLSKQVGRFKTANRSIIFLDEIGDLPMELQAKLLRVFQDNTFERLGSFEPISVDVRVIAAMHHDLAELVRDNKFKRDLYYRLNVFPITVPPCPPCANIVRIHHTHSMDFCGGVFREHGGINQKHHLRTMDKLLSYYWPGNVRDLKKVTERAMIMSTRTTLRIKAGS